MSLGGLVKLENLQTRTKLLKPRPEVAALSRAVRSSQPSVVQTQGTNSYEHYHLRTADFSTNNSVHRSV